MQIQPDIIDFLKACNFFFLRFQRKWLCICLFLVFALKIACPIPPYITVSVCVCVYAQSCLTLYNLTDCSLPGFYVHRIFQARILEWVATSYSRSFSRPKDGTWLSCVSCISKWILYHWTTWEAAHILEDKVKNRMTSCYSFYKKQVL